MERKKVRSFWGVWGAGAAVLASLLATGTVIAGVDETLASAQSSPIATRRPITFDIPRQPLANALDAFGAQANLQILYESSLARGRQAAAVIGVFTPEEALQLLLAGNNLVASYADDKNVIVHPIVPIFLGTDSPVMPAAGLIVLHALKVEPGSVPDYRSYDGLIALDLQKALRRNTKTRDGNYTVDAKLWIGNGGAVERAELTNSSGDKGRDEAIFHTLRDFVVSREPPADLPEPVSVSIAVKSL